MNIGESIRKYRKIKKMSQQDLSLLSGIPRISISRYENGDRTPNIDVINKIANALDVSIENLICDLIVHTYNDAKNFINTDNKFWGSLIPSNINVDIKSKDISKINAKDSLVNLLLYTTNNSTLINNLTTEDLDLLLSKVSDCIEFELYKLSTNSN